MKYPPLRKQFVPQLLLILLLLTAFSITYHFSVVSILRNQVSEDGTRLCNIYIRDMDAKLGEIRNWLEVKFQSDENLMRLSGGDATAWLNAQRDYGTALAEAPALFPSVAMAFLWIDEAPGIISTAAESVGYDHYQALLDAAQRMKNYGGSFGPAWSAIPTEALCVFATTIEVENVVVGVLVEPEALLSSMPFYDESNQYFVLAKHSGYIVSTTLPEEYGEGIDLAGDLSVYYVTGENHDVIVCGAQSQYGPFRLMMLTKDSEIQAALHWTKWALALVMMASIGSAAGILFNLRRRILAPLDKITLAIQNFGQTQLAEPLSIAHEAREFVEIYNAFNTMTKQIRQLKIDNYEHIIHNQQTELRFYQTQIKPHFILNCLTTIGNLAEQRKTEALGQFIADFSGFARCMFKSDFSLVTVEEELKQVEYYVGMQSVLFPNRVFYLPDADENAKKALIPAMLIQTLVENSIKHGMDEYGELSVFVHCVCADQTLTVSVEDSGTGFSEAVLKALNSGGGTGFGLRNLQMTLALLYGDKAMMRLQNIDGGGARVTAVIPQMETAPQAT